MFFYGKHKRTDMEYKRIEDLSISECLKKGRINCDDAKSIITKNNNQEAVRHNLSEIVTIDSPEIADLLVSRMTELLIRDKKDYLNCKNKTDFEQYLSSWSDGIWRKDAEIKIKQIEEAEAERKLYEKSKGTIAGLKKYLKAYPNGRYSDSARKLISDKRRNKKVATISISAIVLLVIATLCYMNYHPVSYVDSLENASIGKRGGTVTRTINTDALGGNIHISSPEEWIKISKDGKDFTIEVKPNHGEEQTGTIRICAYTTLFNFNLSRKETSMTVHQSSGLASRPIEITATEIHFEKYSSDVRTVYASTDGMNMKVSTEGIDNDWVDVSHDISEEGDINRAKITIASHNNEGGEKHGSIVINSDSYSRKINLSQESGLATKFEVSKTEFLIREEGNQEGYYFPIKVNTDGTKWSVKSQPEWDNLNTEVCLNHGYDDELKVTIGENSGRTRIGTITLLSNNGDLADIEIKQWGDPTNLSASRGSLKLGTSGGYEYVSISNDSQKSLSTSVSIGDGSWLSASVSSKTQIRISYSSNNNSPRSGTVYVDCGGERTSITIKQDGWESCSRCDGNGYTKCSSCNNGYTTCTNYNYTGVYDNIGQYGHGKRFPVYSYDPWTGMQLISGYRLEVCPTCGGSYKVKCSYCGGDGRRECSRCDGSGKTRKSY